MCVSVEKRFDLHRSYRSRLSLMLSSVPFGSAAKPRRAINPTPLINHKQPVRRTTEKSQANCRLRVYARGPEGAVLGRFYGPTQVERVLSGRLQRGIEGDRALRRLIRPALRGLHGALRRGAGGLQQQERGGQDAEQRAGVAHIRPAAGEAALAFPPPPAARYRQIRDHILDTQKCACADH